jgi:transcriptional regulator NrdR family protein
MKAIRTAALALAALFLTLGVNAQEFNGKTSQDKLEREIKAAYKSKKLTENEYEKLMKEQYAIKQAIEKYERDEVWTASEKNNIIGRLKKSDKRFEEYKSNNEVY